MITTLFINPEIKRFYLFSTISAGLFTILAILYFGYCFENFNKDLIDKNISVIGNMIEKHPKLKEEIITSYTKKATTDDFKKGIAAAKEYGYDNTLPITITASTKQFFDNILISIIIFFSMCFLSFYIITFQVFKYLYQRIRIAATASERIVEGDYSLKLEEESEGDISKLGHQFNQMTRQLKIALEQLRNEKVTLKNIISDISHQLKTPLSSIKIYNEILLNGDEIHKKDREIFLDKTSEQVERMEWLIQNLLIMARLDVGAITFHNENKRLLPTIEMAVDSLKNKWEEKHQSITIEERNPSISLNHDERWLGEAVSNIVKNSIDHTSIGGNIIIEISENPVMVKIMIKDNGKGISESDLPYIFQRFYQGKLNSKGSGTGIGLTLSKAVIEKQGGLIKVNSKVNEGTFFTITFPKGII